MLNQRYFLIDSTLKQCCFHVDFNTVSTLIQLRCINIVFNVELTSFLGGMHADSALFQR